MIKSALKGLIVCFILASMILNLCVCGAVRAAGTNGELNESIKFKRIRFDAMLLKAGISPALIDDSQMDNFIIPGIEEEMYPNYGIYLNEVEKRLVQEKKFIAEQIEESFNKGEARELDSVIQESLSERNGVIGIDDVILNESVEVPAESMRVFNDSGSEGMLKSMSLDSSENTAVISAGDSTVIFLNEDGNVYQWGGIYEEDPYEGMGYFVKNSIPVFVPFNDLGLNEKVVSVDAGYNHNMALTSEGNLYAWGFNGSGQLGNGSTIESKKPVHINLGGEKVKEISAGDSFSMAVTESGILYTWGFNASGQLGFESSGAQLTPAIVTLQGETVSKVSAGGRHAMALTDSGKLYTWGYNYYGQLGNGTNNTSKVPIEITVPNTVFFDISAGDGHSMAVDTDGYLYTWGYNYNGQLGNGTKNSANSPQRIFSISGAVVKLSADDADSMVLTDQGDAYIWGSNSDGQIGNGDGSVYQNVLTPTKLMLEEEITGIAGGYSFSAVYSSGHQLYMWGSNSTGALGGGGYINKCLPSQIYLSGLRSDERIIKIAGGNSHSIALTDDNRIFTWGSNTCGQLGNPEILSTVTPTEVKVNGEAFVDIAASYGSSYAVTGSGKLYAWGENNVGQLGDGTTSDSKVPKQISVSTDKVVKVAAGVRSVLALTENHEAYGWGENYYGQLGNGDQGYAGNKKVPTKVMIAEDIKKIAMGNSHSGFITTSGNVFLCGENGTGALGDGTWDDKALPVQISVGGKTISDIELGDRVSMALTTAGEVYTWGYNIFGTLGDSGESRYLAAQINVDNKTISKIVMRDFTAMVITDAGEVYAWGCNYDGQLGAGWESSQENFPVKTAFNEANIAYIGLGDSHALAVSGSGPIYTWGNNYKGALGDGWGTPDSYSPVPVKVPKAMEVNCSPGTLANCTLTASQVRQPFRYLYYIVYDTERFAVDDLCADTAAKDTETGYIEGSRVIVHKNDEDTGVIALTFTDSSEIFSGALNQVLLQSSFEGKGKMSILFYVGQ